MFCQCCHQSNFEKEQNNWAEMKFWAIAVVGYLLAPSAVRGDTSSDSYEYYGGYDSPSWHSPSPVSKTQSQITPSPIAIALTVSVRTYKKKYEMRDRSSI